MTRWAHDLQLLADHLRTAASLSVQVNGLNIHVEKMEDQKSGICTGQQDPAGRKKRKSEL